DERWRGTFDGGCGVASLLRRTPEACEGAEAAPNSAAAMNLLRLTQFTNRAEWRDKAQKTLSAFAARLQFDPEAVPALASALDFRLSQTKQILIAGDSRSQDTRELLHVVNARFLPNKVLLLADGGTGQQRLARWLPFVAGAHRVGGRATAYVCENYICKVPTTDLQLLAQLLDKNN